MEAQTANVEDPSVRKKKIAKTSTFALLFGAAILSTLALFTHSSSSSSSSIIPIKLICQPTPYRQQCEDALFKSANSTTGPKLLLQTLFQHTFHHLRSALRRSIFLHHAAIGPTTKSALSNCTSLLHLATDDLNTSIDQLAHLLYITRIHLITKDLKIGLTAVLNYQETCIGGLRNTTGNTAVRMIKALNASFQLSSNSLAIVDNISEVLQSFHLPFSNGEEDGFPATVGHPNKPKNLLILS